MIGLRVVATFAVLCLAATVEAKEIIRCTSKRAPEVVMTLNAQRMLKRNVNCISGEFVADMTPCAPNGGYGLSSPTGSASLVRIVDRWQDYGDHFGAVSSHFITEKELHFSGGFMSPDGGYVEKWTFTANRLTGMAKLKVEKGEPAEGEFVYSCAKASQRF